jgi:DNA repair protein RadC
MRATSHGFADSEILEFYLARAGVASPGRVASSTMSRGLAGVLGASHADLARSTSHQAAVELKLLQEASVRVALAEVVRRDVLTSQSAVATHLKILLAAQPREQLWVLFLDKQNQALLSEKIAEGAVDHAQVYPREIVRRALELNCSALILVHNHPPGHPSPSGADIAMTREVISAAQAMNIVVHDHMVVGCAGVASLRGLGLL